jgi:hypothetical protein
MNDSYKSRPGLQNLVRSVTFLIKEAIFRPESSLNVSGRSTLSISPLSVLVDMYHAHDATQCHDKVFALLGMSTDHLSNGNLSPNYRIPWGNLLQRLLRHVLSEEVSVETWKEDQAAVIKSRGCILGQVVSVETGLVRGSQHCVTLEISPSDIPRQTGGTRTGSAHWTIQATATSIQVGDLVCLLRGASKPSIVRLWQDYFTLIVVAVTFPEETQQKHEVIQWPITRLFERMPGRNFLIVWDWVKSPVRRQVPRQFETWIRTRNWGLEQSHVGTEDHLARVTRKWDVVLILGDLTALPGISGALRSQIKLQMEERGREAVMDFEIAIKNRGPCQKLMRSGLTNPSYRPKFC